MTTTLSAKRQVAIPKEICDRLELKPGARIAWKVEGEKLIGHALPEDIIATLTGVHKDGPDLVARLLADRREGRELSDRKLARQQKA
jgi:AbrB family looped-hinge helix DNA binding protein